ncbi:MAG: SGNH/GDSL hydrolase family protein [Oligoflexia bacterium]|nr:SGNH/GDSL hydrolase family protein [Oligoflexia bacterium]
MEAHKLQDKSPSSGSKVSMLRLALVVLLGLFLALIVIEVAFRLLSPLMAPARWSDRPQFYYKPEAATSLQDFGYPQAKPANTFRISVVGDSFTFGPWLQFDDTFPKRLERLLNLGNGALKAEVINKGIAGYSTRDEVNIVKEAAADNSDLIVLQITLNDPELSIYKPRPGEDPRFGPLRIDPNNRPILYYWKSLGFLAQRIRAALTRKRYEQYYFDLFSADETWGAFNNALQEIAQVSAKAKVPVVAVLFPLFSFPFDDKYPFVMIHQKIAGLLKELNIPLLDLRTLYSGIPPERLHVYPGKDQHPNEIAHRMAAERIYTWLAQENLIPDALKIKDTFRQRQNYKAFFKDRCEKNPKRCFQYNQNQASDGDEE